MEYTMTYDSVRQKFRFPLLHKKKIEFSLKDLSLCYDTGILGSIVYYFDIPTTYFDCGDNVAFYKSSFVIARSSAWRAMMLKRGPGGEAVDAMLAFEYYFRMDWSDYMSERRKSDLACLRERIERRRMPVLKKLGPKPSNNKKLRKRPVTKGKRMTIAEMRETGKGPFDMRCAVMQSGKFDKKAKRDDREVKQREVAAVAAKALRKEVPKEIRLKKIKDSRDKRNPVTVEYQSGKISAAAKILATAGVALGLRKVASAINRGLKTTDDFLKFFVDLKSHLKKALKGGLWLVPFVMALYYVFKFCKLPGALSSAVVVTAITRFTPTRLWNYISHAFHEEKISPIRVLCGWQVIDNCFVFFYF